MAFKVGQKVVCVDDSIGEVSGKSTLTKGCTYTVTDVRRETGGVKLREVKTPNTPGCSGFFCPYRFRPLLHSPCPGSHSIAKKFKEVIETSENPVRETKTEKV